MFFLDHLRFKKKKEKKKNSVTAKPINSPGCSNISENSENNICCSVKSVT